MVMVMIMLKSRDLIIDLLLPSRRHAWQEYGCLALLLLRWPMYMACRIVHSGR